MLENFRVGMAKGMKFPLRIEQAFSCICRGLRKFYDCSHGLYIMCPRDDANITVFILIRLASAEFEKKENRKPSEPDFLEFTKSPLATFFLHPKSRKRRKNRAFQKPDFGIEQAYWKAIL